MTDAPSDRYPIPDHGWPFINDRETLDRAWDLLLEWSIRGPGVIQEIAGRGFDPLTVSHLFDVAISAQRDLLKDAQATGRIRDLARQWQTEPDRLKSTTYASISAFLLDVLANPAPREPVPTVGSWVVGDPFEHATNLLSQQVVVTMARDPLHEIKGQLMEIAEDGEFAVRDATGIVNFAWPALGIRLRADADAVAERITSP